MAVPGPSTSRHLQRAAGNLLRLARIERGWSQRQLAEAARVAQSTVAKIESGARQPSLPTLARLLAAADLDLRLRLAPYDDHDDVLDARHAALTPDQRHSANKRHDERVELVRSARPAPAPPRD